MPLLARLDQLDVSVQSIRQRNQQKHELLNEERGLLHALLQERNLLHSTLLDLPTHAEAIRRESSSLLSRLEEQELYAGIGHDKAERGLLEQLVGFHRAQERAQADFSKAKQALQEVMASQPADVAEAERLRRTSALVSRGPAAMAGALRHMGASCTAAISTARQSVSQAGREAEEAEAQLAATQASVEDLRAKLAVARLGVTAGTRTSLQSWLRVHLRSVQAQQLQQAAAARPGGQQQRQGVPVRRGRSPEQSKGHAVQDLLSAFRRGAGRGAAGHPGGGTVEGGGAERAGTPGHESGRGSPQAVPRYARPLERHVSPPPVPSQSSSASVPAEASLRGRLGLGLGSMGRQALAARQGTSSLSSQQGSSHFGQGRRGSISELLRELPDAPHGARSGSPAPALLGARGGVGMSTSDQLLQELGGGEAYTGDGGGRPPRPVRSSRSSGQAPLPAWAEEDGARIAAALGPVTPRTARLIHQALSGNLEEEAGAGHSSGQQQIGGGEGEEQEQGEGAEGLLRKVTFSPPIAQPPPALPSSSAAEAVAGTAPASSSSSSFYSLFHARERGSGTGAGGRRARTASRKGRASSGSDVAVGSGNAAGSSRDVWSQLSQPKQAYAPPSESAPVSPSGTRSSPLAQNKSATTVFGASIRSMSPPGAGRPIFNRPAMGLAHTVEHANRQAEAGREQAGRVRSDSPSKQSGRKQGQGAAHAASPPTRAAASPLSQAAGTSIRTRAASATPPVRPKLSPVEAQALVNRLYKPAQSMASGRLLQAAVEDSVRAETGQGVAQGSPSEQSLILKASPSPSPPRSLLLRSKSAGASPSSPSAGTARKRSGTPLSSAAAASALIARGAGTETGLMPSHSAETGLTMAEHVALFQAGGGLRGSGGGAKGRGQTGPKGSAAASASAAEGKVKAAKKPVRSQSARKAGGAPPEGSMSAAAAREVSDAFAQNSAFSRLFDPSPLPAPSRHVDAAISFVDGPDAESTADLQAMLAAARRVQHGQQGQQENHPPSAPAAGPGQGGGGARAADLMAALKFIPPPGDDVSSRRTSLQSSSTATAAASTSPHAHGSQLQDMARPGQGVTAIAAAPAAVQPMLESAMVDALAKAFARATTVMVV